MMLPTQRARDVPALPDFDPDPAARARELARQRRRYAYLRGDDPRNPFAPLAVGAGVPLEAQYAPSWVLPYLPLLAAAKAGELAARARHAAARWLRASPRRALHTPRFPRAPHTVDLDSDHAFARERLDGPNPLVLERVRDPARVADFTARAPATLPAALAPDTAAREGRLYVADYAPLRRALGAARDSRWRPRYLAAPVALFVQPAAGAALEPLAVRIDGADPRAPVFFRGPRASWQLARLYTRSADVNHHVLCAHLQRTHFLLDPFTVSTPRQLARRHPVHVLLAPHLRFTRATNHVGNQLLLNESQVFAQLFAGPLHVTRRLVAGAAPGLDLDALALEADLRARGMHDAPLEYPYRDDARLHLAAIERFVRAYLALYYPTEASPARDPELRAWLAELAAPHGGNLRGLPDPAAPTRDALARLLTTVVFTAGPGHAAVHFPQPDYHAEVDAFPAAAYAPPPRSEAEATAALHADALPPLARAAAQFRNAQLAGFRYDRLGDYEGYALGRVEAARPLVARFGAELAEIEARIDARNAARPRPYPYLLPSRVPNSINL